jgi:transposase
MLSDEQQQRYRRYYHRLLSQADRECPGPRSKDNNKRGRVKRSKARSLLERLINYQDDVLRFMTRPDLPFTNNQGERDIRMTKVHQKISGCFRSAEGSNTFCRVRGYLSTCLKQTRTASHAMTLLFNGKLPDFVRFEPVNEN